MCHPVYCIIYIIYRQHAKLITRTLLKRILDLIHRFYGRIKGQKCNSKFSCYKYKLLCIVFVKQGI